MSDDESVSTATSAEGTSDRSTGQSNNSRPRARKQQFTRAGQPIDRRQRLRIPPHHVTKQTPHDRVRNWDEAVSYTPLTLPTIRSV